MRASINLAQGQAILTLTEFADDGFAVMPNDGIGVQMMMASAGSTSCIKHWPQESDGYALLYVHNASFAKIDLTLSREAIEALVASNAQTGFMRVRFPDGNTRTCDVNVLCDLSALLQASAQAPTGGISQSTVQSEPAAQATPAQTAAASSVSTAPAPKSNKLIFIILLAVLFLALIGGLLWFFLGRDSAPASAPTEPVAVSESVPEIAPTVAPEPEPEPEPEPALAPVTEPSPAPVEANTPAPATAVSGPCELNNAHSDGEILQNCLASKPKAPALLTLAQQAVQAERCDLAARLLMSQARAQGGDFALLLAQYFDPNEKTGSSCFKKSADDAIYWYQKAQANAGPAQTKAKTALERLQASGGGQQ